MENNRIPYRVQLDMELINILVHADFTVINLDPVFQENILTHLDYPAGPAEFTDAEKLEMVRQDIIYSISVMYLRLGEYQKFAEIMQHRVPGEAPEIPMPAPAVFDEKGTVYLTRDYISRVNELIPIPWQITYSDIFPDPFGTFETHSCYGLLVAKDRSHAIGVYTRISLDDFTSRAKYAIDQIRIASHLVDEFDILADQTEALCTFFHRNDSQSAPARHFRIEYSIDQPAMLLKGSSAGLVFGLLGETYLRNRPWQSDSEFHLFADVAYSGALDSAGRVQPIDDTDLKYKIQAAFFGPFRIIVLPVANRTTGDSILAKLKADYPGRPLQIKYVSNIEDIFHDPELVVPQRRTLGLKVKQWMVRKNRSLIIGGLLALIIILLAGHWVIFLEKEPWKYSVKNDHYVIRNQYNIPRWETPSLGRSINPRGDNQNIKIQDITNDGVNEVIIGFPRESELGGRLVCYNAAGEKQWDFNTETEAQFGNNLYSHFYSAGQVYIHDLDNDNDMEIIVVSGNKFFPRRIVVLDHQGNFISDYWNSGNIRELAFGEVYPENQVKEIIFAGVNNEYGNGILGVLDPMKMRGSSPQSKMYYTKQGAPPGNVIYYLRFPPTHFTSRVVRDFCGFINVEHGLISVGLYTGLSQKLYKKPGPGVTYHLNQEMIPEFVDLYDSYYNFYRRQFPEREPLPYNNETVLNHFRQILYWNGSIWSEKSAVNAEYLRTVKK